jgi:signal peptidase I
VIYVAVTNEANGLVTPYSPRIAGPFLTLPNASHILFGQNPPHNGASSPPHPRQYRRLSMVLIPVRTDGVSMEPTYESGRLNLVNRLAPPEPPARGDVVAIRLAGLHVLYIKRVVGLPGERIAISAGEVLVDGAPLIEPYVHHRRPWELAEVRLGPAEYVVVGDNRGMAAADHTFGRIDAVRIVGRVVF